MSADEYTPTLQEVLSASFYRYRADSIARALAAHDAEVARAAKSEAWDECMAAVTEGLQGKRMGLLGNPYRKVATDDHV